LIADRAVEASTAAPPIPPPIQYQALRGRINAGLISGGAGGTTRVGAGIPYDCW
jgi:hypothetical protein